MKKQETTGIDVSKATLDVWLHEGKLHKVFSNTGKGFSQLLAWVGKVSKVDFNHWAFCLEYTGMYSVPLCLFLNQNQQCFYLVSGLLVKRSLGLQRGKNDKVDAQALARFAYLHQEELKPYCLPSESITRIKQLLSFRTRLIRQCSGYKVYSQESLQVLGVSQKDLLVKYSRQLISVLRQKIQGLEEELLRCLQTDDQLKETFQNITTIKGVGLILASTLIAHTNNFQSFENWRQFSCYAGIAPFEHRSGSSYRGKTKISTLGNKHLKTLLSQAAATAIQYNPEMKNYYQRRINEGKNKMSTLNIIRNKLVSRIFAVAKRKSPYVDLFKFAA